MPASNQHGLMMRYYRPRTSFGTRLPKGLSNAGLRTVGLPSSFLPRVKKYALRYNTEIQLDTEGVGIAAAIFRCNSPYDPEVILGGHSAYMFDDIMRLYRKYRVVGSKIRVWPIYLSTGTAAASSSAPSYGTILRTSSGEAYKSFANASHLLECNIRGNVKQLGQVNTVALSLGSEKPTLTHTYSQRKTFPGIQDLELEGTHNSDPAKLYYWELVMFSLFGNDPSVTRFRVEINFTVLFSEPVLLSASGISSGGTGINGPAIPGFGSTGAHAPFVSDAGGDYNV